MKRQVGCRVITASVLNPDQPTNLDHSTDVMSSDAFAFRPAASKTSTIALTRADSPPAGSPMTVGAAML
ncbi:hypothetical protein D3C83_265960 [compost metagenome]